MLGSSPHTDLQRRVARHPATVSQWEFGRIAAHDRRAIWLAFVATQLLDGMLTSSGVRLFGMEVEGNPLILWYAQTIGPAAAVWGAKAFAVGCGAILDANDRYGALAAMTVLYLACAVVPWVLLFSGS